MECILVVSRDSLINNQIGFLFIFHQHQRLIRRSRLLARWLWLLVNPPAKCTPLPGLFRRLAPFYFCLLFHWTRVDAQCMCLGKALATGIALVLSRLMRQISMPLQFGLGAKELLAVIAREGRDEELWILVRFEVPF